MSCRVTSKRQGRRETYSVFYPQFGPSGISYDHDTWERRDTPHIFFISSGTYTTFVCGACIVRLSAHANDINKRAPESIRSLTLAYNKHTVRRQSEMLGKDWAIIGSQVR